MINGFNFVAGAAIDFLNWAKGGVALKWAAILQPSKPSKLRPPAKDKSGSSEKSMSFKIFFSLCEEESSALLSTVSLFI